MTGLDSVKPAVYARALEAARTPTERRAVVAALERRLMPTDWQGWLRRYFPEHTQAPFSPFHARFWDWAWGVRLHQPAASQLLCWGRGLAKSTSAELAVAAFAARKARRYCLYVGDKGDRANDHVSAIAGMLESPRFGRAYPAVQERSVGMYGQPRGWRRNRLRTASGFTVDAVGLDMAIRGVRIDADRPDLVILDDIDALEDNPGTVQKKVDIITKSIIGAGSGGDLIVIFAQNLVHADGIMSRLIDGRADFLRNAQRSGPLPAIDGFVATDTPDGWRITAGTPTWAGFSIQAAELLMAQMSLAAFKAEYQNDVDALGGGMFDHLSFERCSPGAVPPLVEVTVWIDPAVTSTDRSDACAIQCDGWGSDGKLYRLRSFEDRTTPTLVLRQALLWAYEHGASFVGIETDQGRETWGSVYREALTALLEERPELRDKPTPGLREALAGVTQQSKAARATQMIPAYEQHRVVHVGDADLLERALVRFPMRKPWDLVDASVWSFKYLWDRYAAGWQMQSSAELLTSTRLPE